MALVTLFASAEWQGGKLIQLDSDLSRPNAAEVALNYPWLKAIAGKFRQSIPSGFFLCDVMLWLDRLFGGRLLPLAWL